MQIAMHGVLVLLGGPMGHSWLLPCPGGSGVRGASPWTGLTLGDSLPPGGFASPRAASGSPAYEAGAGRWGRPDYAGRGPRNDPDSRKRSLRPRILPR